MIKILERLIFSAARHRLRRFSGRRNKVAELFSSALDSAGWGKITDADAQWIERIEQLRSKLKGSHEVISIEDFGAGASRLIAAGVPPRGSIVKTVGEICRTSSISRTWGSLLFHIVRHTRPSVCLEMGTSLGISASYLGAACAVNGNGTVVTLERATAIAGLAEKNFASLHLDMITVVPGQFQNTLESVLKKHRPIDLAFIDGHHDRDATLKYFGQIKPHLSGQAIVIFDDILWSRGMRQAWREICTMDGFFATVDLSRMGVYLSEG